MQVYLDNAATTAPYPEVLAVMTPYLKEFYGNPSSIHATGRKARAAIEQARKTIAKLIGASSAEIIFTSGGTEADNIFLQGIVHSVSHIISSPIEHPAVLQTLTGLADSKAIGITWLDLENNGTVTLESIKNELVEHPGALVVLMHGNNEVGNLLPLDKVAALCSENEALFFTDAVQTTGHYPIDVTSLNINGLAASAHKFHGPKGAGFLYLKKGTKLSAVYHGGEQERGISVGTENVASIVGMARALELSYASIDKDRRHIELLKRTLIDMLIKNFPGVSFNGTSANFEDSIFTVLSVSIPKNAQNEMLLFNLDLANIAVSAGSACASGAAAVSHVLEALDHDPQRAVIRFSFSKFNTLEEINYVIKKLIEIYRQN
jgi:cysteine desulfurase